MQSLIDSHLFLHRLTKSEFFRSAYQWSFGKDVPINSLNEDIALYEKNGTAPPYVVKYVIGIYGVH